MRTDQDYYRTLGLPRDATPDQIKQRYREMVRKYHPDVAQDKTLSHQTFVSIQEAYRVLGDPDRRAEYDRRSARPTPPPSSSTSGRPAGPTVRSRNRSEVERLLDDAQLAFVRRQMTEAQRCCRRVLQLEPHNVRAYTILGDVYSAVGRINEALDMYSYAQQRSPQDIELVRKLNRLRERERRKAERTTQPDHDNSIVRPILLSIGWVAVGALYVLSIQEGPRLDGFSLLEHIPGNLLWLTLGGAVVLGALFGAAQIIGRFDDEMLFAPHQHRLGGGAPPIGLVVPLVSILSLYLAGLIYIILALGQDRVSASVAKAFGMALLTTFVFTAPHLNTDPTGSILPEMLLWVSGPAFTGFCLGWLMSDTVRPHW